MWLHCPHVWQLYCCMRWATCGWSRDTCDTCEAVILACEGCRHRNGNDAKVWRDSWLERLRHTGEGLGPGAMHRRQEAKQLWGWFVFGTHIGSVRLFQISMHAIIIKFYLISLWTHLGKWFPVCNFHVNTDLPFSSCQCKSSISISGIWNRATLNSWLPHLQSFPSIS